MHDARLRNHIRPHDLCVVNKDFSLPNRNLQLLSMVSDNFRDLANILREQHRRRNDMVSNRSPLAYLIPCHGTQRPTSEH
jgi:hypothetical protein